MVKSIETASGFKCEIDDSCLDDMELFDAICEVENGKTLSVSIILDKILKDEKSRLYDHCRDKATGRVPTMAVTSELTDIIGQLGKK